MAEDAISITEHTGAPGTPATITMTSPYYPGLAEQAKNLGGKWDPRRKAWTFDARDLARVKKLLMDTFGHDGDPDHAPERVTLHLLVNGFTDYGVLWLCGRRIVERRGRDAEVQLGDGVILLHRSFPPSGGSSKNPRLEARPGTVLEVRDVPLSLATKAIEKFPKAVAFAGALDLPAAPTS